MRCSMTRNEDGSIVISQEDLQRIYSAFDKMVMDMQEMSRLYEQAISMTVNQLKNHLLALNTKREENNNTNDNTNN